MDLSKFSKLLEFSASAISAGGWIKKWQEHIKKEEYAGHALAEAVALFKSAFKNRHGVEFILDFENANIEALESNLKLIEKIVPGAVECLVSSEFVDISTSTSVIEHLDFEHDFFSKKHEVMPTSFLMATLPKGVLWKKWCEHLNQRHSKRQKDNGQSECESQNDLIAKALLERFEIPENGGIAKLCLVLDSVKDNSSQIKMTSICALDFLIIILKYHNSPVESDFNKQVLELLEICSESKFMDSKHWLLIDKITPKHLKVKVESLKEKYFLSKTIAEPEIGRKLKEKEVKESADIFVTNAKRIRAL